VIQNNNATSDDASAFLELTTQDPDDITNTFVNQISIGSPIEYIPPIRDTAIVNYKVTNEDDDDDNNEFLEFLNAKNKEELIVLLKMVEGYHKLTKINQPSINRLLCVTERKHHREIFNNSL